MTPPTPGQLVATASARLSADDTLRLASEVIQVINGAIRRLGVDDLPDPRLGMRRLAGSGQAEDRGTDAAVLWLEG